MSGIESVIAISCVIMDANRINLQANWLREARAYRNSFGAYLI